MAIAALERAQVIRHEVSISREQKRKDHPFLVWDMLEEAKLDQIWRIPPEHYEVVKTAIVIDGSFPGLTLDQKRRLLILRVWWDMDGDYSIVKPYLPENATPSWDALLWTELDSTKSEQTYLSLEEAIEDIDGVVGKSMNIVGFINKYRKIRALEDQGLTQEQIVERREEIMSDRKPLQGLEQDTRELRYLKLRRQGLSGEEIRQKWRSLGTERLDEIETRLTEEGFLFPHIPEFEEVLKRKLAVSVEVSVDNDSKRNESSARKITKPVKLEERLRELLPYRGIFSVEEIADKTGYPVDLVKSVFKRAIKRGLIKPLDKKEVVTRGVDYEIYNKIREGVQRLRLDLDKRYTEQEIADILSEELDIKVTKQQVKRQIRVLLKDKKIERRVNQVK